MITLTELKSYLVIDETENDALIQGFITTAISKINSMCNRKLVADNFTEVITSNIFTDRIYLKNTPINLVTSIEYYDGEEYLDLFNSPDELSDIFENLEDYLLMRKGYSVEGKNLRVVYNGGYKFVQGTGKLKCLSSVNVTDGLGVSFANVDVGDYITFEGERRLVSAKADSTHLTLSEPATDDYTAVNFNISNVPEDLRQFCKELCKKLYDESPLGKDMLLRSNESNENDSASFKDWDNSGLISQYRFINI